MPISSVGSDRRRQSQMQGRQSRSRYWLPPLQSRLWRIWRGLPLRWLNIRPAALGPSPSRSHGYSQRLNINNQARDRAAAAPAQRQRRRQARSRAMPPLISTSPSRAPSISSSSASHRRGRSARSAQSAMAKAGITQVSGWKSNRLALNTTGCSHQRPQINQQRRSGRPACRASHQMGSAVRLSARA